MNFDMITLVRTASFFSLRSFCKISKTIFQNKWKKQAECNCFIFSISINIVQTHIHQPLCTLMEMCYRMTYNVIVVKQLSSQFFG